MLVQLRRVVRAQGVTRLPFILFSSTPLSGIGGGWPRLSSTARIERGPSDGRAFCEQGGHLATPFPLLLLLLRPPYNDVFLG